jgi:hypothetical protein
LTVRDTTIGEGILKEIRQRLQFMADVGLDYLTLDRSAVTLSGGEAQRIRLATQIGSRLMGVLYVLDEPSIGLHHRDNERLIGTLTCATGNTGARGRARPRHYGPPTISSTWGRERGAGRSVVAQKPWPRSKPTPILTESTSGRMRSRCRPSGVRSTEVAVVRGRRRTTWKKIDVAFLGVLTCAIR